MNFCLYVFRSVCISILDKCIYQKSDNSAYTVIDIYEETLWLAEWSFFEGGGGIKYAENYDGCWDSDVIL